MVNPSTYLQSLGNDIITAMRSDINNSSGELSKSITAKVTKDSYGTHMNIVLLKYGLYVDEGTKPHMPPVDALRNWATSKGLNPWAVVMSIKKKGTEAHPFIYNFEKVIKANQQELIKVFGFDINNVVTKELKKAWQ